MRLWNPTAGFPAWALRPIFKYAAKTHSTTADGKEEIHLGNGLLPLSILGQTEKKQGLKGLGSLNSLLLLVM